MKTAIFSVSLSEYQTVNPISTKDGRIAWTHGSYIRALFYTSCYYSLNPRCIFQQMTSFSQFLNQDLGLSEITGGRKLSEIKV